VDLNYPDDAERFRIEIRQWLVHHLPPGWFEPGFEMFPIDRATFNESWLATLYGGGWICLTQKATDCIGVTTSCGTP
jgi:hypothetical protein